MSIYSVAEYAALVIGVVQLCAVGGTPPRIRRKTSPATKIPNVGQRNRCRVHASNSRGMRTKCPCGIHAHPKEWCFERMNIAYSAPTSVLDIQAQR
jgi:hypothetical protein